MPLRHTKPNALAEYAARGALKSSSAEINLHDLNEISVHMTHLWKNPCNALWCTWICDSKDVTGFLLCPSFSETLTTRWNFISLIRLL